MTDKDTERDDFVLTLQELPAALEGILFAAGDPISLSRLEEITNVDKEVLEQTLAKLITDYENNPWGGILIRKLENEYVMCTKSRLRPVFDRMFRPKSRPPMSQATYETLSVIAYNQPVTRAQVESVRGVSSDSIISRLLDRGWIEECGTLDAPGRPVIFRTTQQFLMEFGITSVSELPAMELMMYGTIRDLEDSLETAAGSKDTRQLSIDQMSEDLFSFGHTADE